MTKKPMDVGEMSTNPETKGGTRRSSTGELDTRSSFFSSTSNEKPLPNYLRASTGSCHDFCKYGRKHVSETATQRPHLLKTGSNLTGGEEPHEVNNSSTEERRKRLMVKLKSSSHQRGKFPNKTEVYKQKAASKMEGRSPQMTNNISAVGLALVSPLAQAHGPTDQRNEREESTKSKETTVPLKKKIMNSSIASPSLKHSGDKILSLKQRQYKLGKQTTAVKNIKHLHGGQSKGEKRMHVTDKLQNNVNLDSAEQNPEGENVVSDSSKEPISKFKNSDLNSWHRNFLKQEEEISLESVATELADQEFLKPKNADMDIQEKLLRTEGVDLDSLEVKHNDNKFLKQESAEKDFYEKKFMKRENINLDSLELNSNGEQSSHSASNDEEETEELMSAHSGSIKVESENVPKESNINNEKSEGEKRRARKNAAVHPQVELSTPCKLKFRRGKIIDLQLERSGPRRLRFRRGRLVAVNVNGGQSERKNFRSSEKIAEGSDSNANAQSVVLKHQEQEKKDKQGLFNSVIEETASKLVESRKSKVKALVGAFETVISLQDSKPASTA